VPGRIKAVIERETREARAARASLAAQLHEVVGRIETVDRAAKVTGQYEGRNALVLVALATAALLGVRHGIDWDADSTDPDVLDGRRAVVRIALPTGVVGWHLPEWEHGFDGATPEQKYERIRAWDGTPPGPLGSWPDPDCLCDGTCKHCAMTDCEACCNGYAGDHGSR
jgi:hypothetical protein